jgi:hypothetical protein
MSDAVKLSPFRTPLVSWTLLHRENASSVARPQVSPGDRNANPADLDPVTDARLRNTGLRGTQIRVAVDLQLQL